jgi:hypothetical protein
LWALTDDVLTEDVRAALKQIGTKRQESVFSKIKTRLLPPEDDTDGAYFDPSYWPYGDVGVNIDDGQEALACLGLFRVMMRFQERGFERREMSSRDVAMVIAKMRRTTKASQKRKQRSEAKQEKRRPASLQ